jgi:hypothetical protein
MAWAARLRAAAVELLGPDAEALGPFVRRALQFGGVCYCIDQFGFHLSMVRGLLPLAWLCCISRRLAQRTLSWPQGHEHPTMLLPAT